jgi:hypothetical protein
VLSHTQRERKRERKDVLKSDAEAKTTGFKIFFVIWQNVEAPFHADFNLKNPNINLKKSKTQSVPTHTHTHTHRQDVLKNDAEPKTTGFKIFFAIWRNGEKRRLK